MYEIIVQGGGEIIWKCLNAIAMFSADGPNGFFGSLLFLSIYLCMVGIAAELVIRHDIATLAKKMVISLFLLSIMLLPSSKVLVTDTVTNFKKPVDHVPWLLAATASISSNIGHAIAAQFDLVFSDPGYPKYTKTGMTMYSDLISKVSEARLPSMQQNEDMKNFISQCVIYDLALGKYPLETLMDAPNVFEFINQKTSKNRGIVLSIEGRNKFVTCNKILDTIFVRQNYLKDYVSKFARVFNPDYAGNQENLNRWFVANMSDSYRYLTKAAGEAEDILKINMLRNVIKDWRADHSPDIAMAYAVAHAEQNQSFTFKSMGKSAGSSVPIIKIIIEVLAISLFPVVAVISLFHNGLSILKKYIGMFCWIQVWPLLFTVLNMVFVTYAQYKGHALTSQGLTLGNIGALSELNDSISAYAGYAMALVPFLSFMLVQGAHAFGQLSTSIIGATQSAVGSAANEAATGNYSVNTVRMDDHNRHNESGFKYDSNVSYAKDKQTWQQLDGSLEQTMPNGMKLLDMGPALPKLNSSIKMSDSLASVFNESANQSIQSAYQESQGASSSINAAFNKLDEFRQTRARDISNSESYNKQETALKETSFGKYDDLVTKFAEDNRLVKDDAQKIFFQINGGLKILGFGGMNAGIDYSNNNTNSEVLSKAQEYSTKHAMSDMFKHAIQEGKEGRLGFLNIENNSYGEAISSSLNKADSKIYSAQTSLNKADYYQKQASYIQQNGLSIDQDLTKQYWDSLVKAYGSDQAKEIVSNPGMNYEYMRQFSNAKRDQLIHQFEVQRPTDPFRVQDGFTSDRKMLEQSDNIVNISNNNMGEILNKRDESNLKGPIITNIKEETIKNIQEIQTSLDVKRNEINIERNDFSTNVDSDLKKRPGEKDKEGDNYFTD